MKPIQYFSAEYLKQCRKATPTQIVKFLDDYRLLQDVASRPILREQTKLISLRLPVRLLAKLKTRARKEGIPYQTLMKAIIEENA